MDLARLMRILWSIAQALTCLMPSGSACPPWLGSRKSSSLMTLYEIVSTLREEGVTLIVV